MHTTLADIRYGAQALARNPLFALCVIASLGLGVGVNSALYGIFRSILWRPLDVAAPSELVTVATRQASQRSYVGFTYAEYEDYAREAAFAGLASYAPINAAFSERGRPSTLVFGEAVSDNYFDVMRPRFQLGRGFSRASGSAAGADPIAVLSDAFWRTQFAADPSIVGRTITVDGRVLTVVGVTAPGFHGAIAYYAPQLWIPVRLMPVMGAANERWLVGREADLRYQLLIGRLRTGTTFEQANAQVAMLSERLAKLYPVSNEKYRSLIFREIDTRPSVNDSGTVTSVAMIFLGVTSLVLLVVCANVANLLLARSDARRREIASRVALGATRARVVRQLLTESMLLATVAGVVGYGVASLTTALVGTVRMPTDVPVAFDLRSDLRVALFSFVVALLCGVAFGLLPALRATSADVVSGLKGRGPQERRRFPLSSGLVVAQLAVSLTLVAVAGLFTRNLLAANVRDIGFKTDDRATFVMDAALVGYDAERATRLFQAIAQRVRALPGVQAASLVRWMPLDMRGSAATVTLERGDGSRDNNPTAVGLSAVDEAYFRTVDTPFLQGRAFERFDTGTSARVAVVNEAFARRYWPGEPAIGKRIWIAADRQGPTEIVGVVATGKYGSLGESPRPHLFVPFAQRSQPSAALVLWARGDVGRVLAKAREAAQALEPTLPVFDARTLAAQVEGRLLLLPRLATALVVPVALLALMISMVGLYGVVACTVTRRTREVGIRVAIGASPQDIVRLIAGRHVRLIAAGTILGLAGALAVARVVGGMLFAVTSFDPAVFIVAPVVLVAVAGAASYLPARRALRVDPLAALRHE